MDKMIKETWHPVVGYGRRYFVSNLGRVKTTSSIFEPHVRRGLIFKRRPNKNGYIRITLRQNGGRQSKHIHILVLEAFVGPCPDEFECNHKNGNRSDNRLENLEWVSHSENMIHAYRVLKAYHPVGEQTGPAKLTTDQVKEIRRLHAAGNLTYVSLGKQFNVTPENVSHIVRRLSWRHI